MPAELVKHRSPTGSKHKQGLTLERFAAAKSSGYNKRERKEKQSALDAKKVNKYRKLKRKLQQQGTLPGVSQAENSRESKLRKIQERAGSPPADNNDPDSNAEQANHDWQQSQALHEHQQPTMQDAAGADEAARLQHTSSSNIADSSEQKDFVVHQPGAHSQPSMASKGKKHKRQKPESHLQKLAKQVHADKEAALQERQAAQQAAAERKARVAEVEKQRKQQTSLLRKRTRSGQPVMKHRIHKILDALQP